MSVRILHISDIHNGYEWQYNTIDDKTKMVTENIAKFDSLDMLRNKLLKLSPKPKYVIITGDIGHQGNSEKRKEFYKILIELSSAKILPKMNNIIIVPGNHDINTTKITEWNKKMVDFYSDVPNGCILPINKYETFEISHYKEQIREYLTKSRRQSTKNLPFLLDRKEKIIIYALNSCQFCQCKVDSETIDMPRIDMGELDVMKFTFEILKDILNVEFDKYLTICAMHHNLSPLATFEEDKKFEIMPNSGLVKKIFSECGIKILLHGHKHWPEVYYDTVISNSGGYAAISGSSICQKPNTGDCGFYAIDYDKKEKDYIKTAFFSIESTSDIDVDRICINLNPPINKFSCLYNKKDICSRTCSFLSDHIINIHEDVGWDKLVIKHDVIGTIGSAIGLVIMQENHYLDYNYLINRQKIIDTIWRRRKEPGGFGAYINNESFIEATCWVAKAMLKCGELDKYIITMEDLVKMIKTTVIRSLSVCTISLLFSSLITYNNIIPSSNIEKIILDIKNYLLSIVIKEKYFSWGENNSGNANDTAHVIVCLNEYQQKYKYEKEIDDCIKEAVSYLIYNDSKWCDMQERIRHNREEMVYEHYALPWCLRAILETEEKNYNQKTQNHLKKLLSTYKNGIWKRNEIKIWEIYDSLSVINLLGQYFTI